MKRGIAVFASAAALMGIFYFSAGKWAIHHSTVALADILRDDRDVTVEVSVRRDREMEAMAEMIELPVVILSHGNTVKHTEYSFLTNTFAARGYLVVSIQHDLSTDDPMVTKAGEEYVGRRSQYNRGIANILFTIDALKKVYPNADYRHLTLVGHSNGGDISMYFAKLHPELVKKVVTLDNLRVPFVTDGRVKILSFRSRDPQFKADPGVVPDDETCAKAGIQVVRTEFQHNDLSDRGSDQVKGFIGSTVDDFLNDLGEDDSPFNMPRPSKPHPTIDQLAASVPDR
ncbi:alpha/beta hydrolase [Bradyrhizobium sp. CIAT3101]|uniref:alpha/beta fold hydrolase n=1 Tax=Bradyrhizobium sp. CIAT3101 TaxID=439387 RepID=UPI0024B12BF4|nr:alpha/beta hydrolase [Bradyrhizobium sp. CIAT3101]WFU83392.1 alpha/beta hydrolase [Bradyrhizobium sp. CIAT3101]